MSLSEQVMKMAANNIDPQEIKKAAAEKADQPAIKIEKQVEPDKN